MWRRRVLAACLLGACTADQAEACRGVKAVQHASADVKQCRAGLYSLAGYLLGQATVVMQVAVCNAELI